MKFVVISDTHKILDKAIETIKKEKPDFCIHLGDVVQDCEDLERLFPNQKFIFVKGNNDFWTKNASFPDERIFTLDGKKFFICHGHTYHVKQGLYALLKKAKDENADIVLYGHTHQSYLEQDDITVMNPGSYGKYGVITIENGKVTASIENLLNIK